MIGRGVPPVVRNPIQATASKSGYPDSIIVGMFGVDGFTPVINPPNAGILGVGRIRDDVAWSDDGAIRRVRRMTLSLTWDHRVTDGAPAAQFVQSIGQYLDDPSTLV